MGKRSDVPHRDEELAKLTDQDLTAKMAKLAAKRIHWIERALEARSGL